jgi:maleylpyruvate isomerase
MKLYGFFLSSAAYRVRIALALKGLQCETASVHLGPGRDEQERPEFLALNPQGLLPVLVDGPAVLTQSLAIIEYLEELHPAPALLPARPADRAYVRAIALAIACEIHPLNNKRVLRYLRGPLRASKEDKDQWYRHWIGQGLDQLEAQVRREPRVGRCAFGDEPGLAECCLVPQVTNALRFGCDLANVPTLMRIYEHCMAMPAFVRASPAHQPDAQKELLTWL